MIDFKHIQSAHCETGVTSNLLFHNGIDTISEPLAFGIGSGLFFIYIPFLKVNHAPAISFRTMPGMIFKRTCNALKIPVIQKKFRSESEAMEYLDQCIDKSKPVGCQVGVYYLTYFPKEYRFHFNAHNLVVFGKENNRYLISDPVMENTTELTGQELQRVRFAKGPLAPKGQLYYPEIKEKPDELILRKAIVKGIKRNVRDMLYIPGPFAGVSGIRFTAGKIKKWRGQLGTKKAGTYLAQLVRMQEEIGTGGGGFRFMYAAFLEQSYQHIPNEGLKEVSEMFTEAGDIWRSSAVQASGIFKGRITEQSDFDLMADYLYKVADLEKTAFKKLAGLKLTF
ncbi:MAG: BtrH N-terminal domain-containing protein [Flavobacteriales bacterium]|nr:BtrH N-terminal domain-containing protein [Flavobacteriales bacterium]